MFGLKVIKEEDYLNLQEEVSKLTYLVESKESRVVSLENEIKSFKSTIASLRKELALYKGNEKNAVLLTDVAETPLTVDNKTQKKKHRIVKRNSNNNQKELK